jgi:hypothetical protein
MIVDVIVPIGLVLSLMLGYDHAPAPTTDTRVASGTEEIRTALPPDPPPSPSRARARVVRGTASTYGPGYAGLLALPSGRGHRVRICGPVACIERTSNDKGPARRLHRVADLNVADFEKVSGASWRKGLVRVTVEYLR